MAENSKIQWTSNTWNPWHGCKKVSPGCKYCYMYRDKERYNQDPTTVMRSKANFNQPLKWKEPQLIFTCSWSDWFIDEADEWRDEAWRVIKATPHHTYQILTKRPERILSHLPSDWGEGYPNVWLGVSAENNHILYDRLFILFDVPAKTRFVSIEPMIDKIDLMASNEFLHWVIVGAESGNETGKYRYRPAKLEWFEKVVMRAKKNEIPIFVKQLGTHLAKELGLKDRHGGDINEWPEELKVRQFPIR